LTYKSKFTFLSIFNGAQSPLFVAQSVNLSLVKFIFVTFLCKNTLVTTDPRRKMCSEDTDSKVICDTKSSEHVEGTESTRMKMITCTTNATTDDEVGAVSSS